MLLIPPDHKLTFGDDLSRSPYTGCILKWTIPIWLKMFTDLSGYPDIPCQSDFFSLLKKLAHSMNRFIKKNWHIILHQCLQKRLSPFFVRDKTQKNKLMGRERRSHHCWNQSSCTRKDRIGNRETMTQCYQWFPRIRQSWCSGLRYHNNILRPRLLQVRNKLGIIISTGVWHKSFAGSRNRMNSTQCTYTRHTFGDDGRRCRQKFESTKGYILSIPDRRRDKIEHRIRTIKQHYDSSLSLPDCKAILPKAQNHQSSQIKKMSSKICIL